MIILREAREADLSLILAWRNQRDVWEGFYQQEEPILWENHYNWYKSRANWKQLIIELVEDLVMRPIGVVTLGQLDHWSPEIGYYLNVADWGKGYGREAVRQATEWLKGKGYSDCHTTVKKDNKRSLGLLRILGFKFMAEAREGEIWLSKRLT